jgi:hypothetical protein
MAIDILNIKPSVISRDLKGKYVLVYSQPKVGKTSFAASFPRNLLLAFEKGYNAIGGVLAADINKWSDVKLILRQLEKPEARAMYDTVTIDTVSIAWDLCEQFICAQAGVQKINEIPWGQGYTQLTQEFESFLRKITMLGYGLVLITHVDVRRETVNDNEVEFFAPSLNKRCYPICNKIVDIIGYIGIEWNEDGSSERWLYTRKTPTIMAGSRFKHLAPKIKFGYDELVKAIGEAIDKSEKIDGATVVDNIEVKAEEKLNYNQLKAEAIELWTKLVGEGENADADMAQRILKRVEMIFGRPVRLSEITEDQVDLYQLVLLDMRELAAEKN